jgi:beta-1,4-mannosyl-glycoprotein beta-1,4-N-acetylglucosaminyltransferase
MREQKSHITIERTMSEALIEGAKDATDSGQKRGLSKARCIGIIIRICVVSILVHELYLGFTFSLLPSPPSSHMDKSFSIDENAILFDPVVVESRCSSATGKRKRVIDVTRINNELSTLELRLNELWNVVDVFYIMETTVRFRPGMPPKPLYLTENWDRFKKFHSKIVLEVLPPEASQGAANDTFGIQSLQRKVHWNLLKEKIEPSNDDLIIYSDLDELPRPDEIEKLACEVNLPRTPICLETKDSFYYYNYLCHIKFEWVNNPKIIHYAEDSYTDKCATSIKNGSTHCSSCFATIEEYEIKAQSNSEEIRDPMVTNRDSILKTVRGCKDFWLRKQIDSSMELRETINPESIPLTVRKHPDRWPHYLGKGPLYEDTIPSQQDAATVDNVSDTPIFG